MQNSEMVALFQKIIDDSRSFTYDKLSIEENGKRKYLHNLWQEYTGYIEKIEKVERFTSMIPPVTSAYFRKVLPLIVLPACELYEGDTHRLDDIMRLGKALEEDDSLAVWNRLSEKFRGIMESMEFTADSDLYTDIVANVHILIEAFSFLEKFDFSGQSKYKRAYQVRKGKKSEEAPVFINTVTVFRNMHDIVKACESSAINSFIMFAAVRMTYGDTNDYLSDWCRGYNEQKSNVMGYKHLTEEEYRVTEDVWKRKVYLVIKNGENIWMLPDSCASSTSVPNNFYKYGNRKTYFPYQVLFDEFRGMPEGTTMLTTTNNSYKLSKIVDEEQKIYIPIIMYEVKRRFFDEEPPMLETVILPQESVLTLSGGMDAKNELLDNSTNRQYVFSGNEYAVSSLFADLPATHKMIEILQLTEADIQDAPVLPTMEGLTAEEYEDQIKENIKTAYEALIDKRLKELDEIESKSRRIATMQNESFISRKEELKEMLEKGSFVQYSNDVVHKKYGCTTSSLDKYVGMNKRMVLYPDDAIREGSSIPVCIKVRPFSKAEILEFYGWKDDDSLPFLIKYRDVIAAYQGYDSVKNRGERGRNSGLGMVTIYGMNAIMGIRYYKKYLEKYFNQKKRYEIDYTYEQEEEIKKLQTSLEQRGYKTQRYGGYTNTLIAYLE